jgi:3-deoxy-D-manno-octulosonic-acid transferase
MLPRRVQFGQDPLWFSLVNGIFYSLATTALLFLAPFYLLWRGQRQREYLRHIGERYGMFPVRKTRTPIWVHAVSLGETRAAAPLIRALQEKYPDKTLLLTHGTPTGRQAGLGLFGNTVIQAYLPYDHPWLARRFFRCFRPAVGLIMETEVWPNFLKVAQDNGTPIMLVNARLSEHSFMGYRRWGRFANEAFSRFAIAAAQTEEDAQRLRQLGCQRVEVAGNLKFDLEVPEAARQLANQFRKWVGERPVFLAASTRDGEEALVLDALSAIAIPDLLTVIVPRHPQRFESVARLLESREVAYQRRSEDRSLQPDTRVWLGDSMGELFAYYLGCDAAYIGGSLLPLGGQNPIEAMACGRPVLFGPHTWNFDAVARQAVDSGAALRVDSSGALGSVLQSLFSDPQRMQAMGEAGKGLILRHRHATARIMDLIAELPGLI